MCWEGRKPRDEILASAGNVGKSWKMLLQRTREGMALREGDCLSLLSSPTTSSVPWPPTAENMDFVG